MSLFKNLLLVTWCLGGLTFLNPQPALALDYEDYPSVKLRTLDKITARTMTFEAKVGTTMKFGEIYIKVQTCRKPPPVEKTEAAAFLQIWQTDALKNTSSWIFSGWMFASSPVVSAMNHPVYDVWVIDCLGKNPEELPPEATEDDDGVVAPGSAQAQPPAQDPDNETVGPGTQGAAPDPVVEEEPVPASNLPSDAEAVPQTEPEPQPAPEPQTPAVPPVQAAPEPQAEDPSPEGIY